MEAGHCLLWVARAFPIHSPCWIQKAKPFAVYRVKPYKESL